MLPDLPTLAALAGLGLDTLLAAEALLTEAREALGPWLAREGGDPNEPSANWGSLSLQDPVQDGSDLGSYHYLMDNLLTADDAVRGDLDPVTVDFLDDRLRRIRLTLAMPRRYPMVDTGTRPVPRRDLLAFFSLPLWGAAVLWDEAARKGVVLQEPPQGAPQGTRYSDLRNPYAPLVVLLERGLFPVGRRLSLTGIDSHTGRNPRAWCILAPAW